MLKSTTEETITESKWEKWMLSATTPNLARLEDIEDRKSYVVAQIQKSNKIEPYINK